MERARFLRRGAVEILNSRGEWQLKPDKPISTPLGNTLVRTKDQWRPALSVPSTIEKRGIGQIRKTGEGRDRQVVREIVIGTRREGNLLLAPALAQRFARKRVAFDALQSEIIPKLIGLSGGHLASIDTRGEQLVAVFSYAQVSVDAWVDAHDAPLLAPPERRDLPPPCRECVEQSWCSTVEIATHAAHAWRRLGLIEPNGVPTRRGIVFSYFHHGEGLAIAAALEDEGYPTADLIFDLANLRAGPRFAGDDSPLGGRLGFRSQQTYDRADFTGYLTMGVPIDYGAGASEAMRAYLDLNVPRSKLLSESLRAGDFERAIIEWRSLLRHIVWAPDCDWPRWRELKVAATAMLVRTESERLSTLTSKV
jgi:hypothetical protein